jgi:DNA gyrase subunit A
VLIDVIVGSSSRSARATATSASTEIVAGRGRDLHGRPHRQHEPMVVTCSHKGYIKRTPLSDYRAQRRGGKGAGRWRRATRTSSTASSWRARTTTCCSSPTGGGCSQEGLRDPGGVAHLAGRSIVNFVGIDTERRRAPSARRSPRSCPSSEFKEGLDLVTARQGGLVKRTALSAAYENIRRRASSAWPSRRATAAERASSPTPGTSELIGTRGHVHPLRRRDIRQVGRDSRGVRGIELREGDFVVSMDVIDDPPRSRC